MNSTRIVFAGQMVLGFGFGVLLGAMMTAMGEPYGSLEEYGTEFLSFAWQAGLLLSFFGSLVALTVANTSASNWPPLHRLVRCQLTFGILCLIEAPLYLVATLSDPNMSIGHDYRMPGWAGNPLVIWLGSWGAIGVFLVALVLGCGALTLASGAFLDVLFRKPMGADEA